MGTWKGASFLFMAKLTIGKQLSSLRITFPDEEWVNQSYRGRRLEVKYPSHRDFGEDFPIEVYETQNIGGFPIDMKVELNKREKKWAADEIQRKELENATRKVTIRQNDFQYA